MMSIITDGSRPTLHKVSDGYFSSSINIVYLNDGGVYVATFHSENGLNYWYSESIEDTILDEEVAGWFELPKLKRNDTNK